MWDIAVCESDPIIVEILKHKLNVFYGEHGLGIKIHVYADGCTLIDNLNDPMDLIILDTRLSDVDGYSMAELLRTRRSKRDSHIIFIGRNDSSMQTAFLFQPFGYIRKDHFEEDTDNVLLRLWEVDHLERTVEIIANRRRTQMRISRIMYIESQGDYLTVRCIKGESYRFKARMSRYDMLLDEDYYFVHSSKSFLVNCAYVNIIKKWVYLKDGTELPCSDSCRKNMRRVWEKYMNDTMKPLR